MAQQQQRPVVPLAHTRTIGYGNRAWAYPRYLTAGPTRALSAYDQPTAVKDLGEGVDWRYHQGVVTSHSRAPVAEPTINRQARASAVYDSAPNAAFWGGYWNSMWSGPYGLSDQSGRPGALVNPVVHPPHRPLASQFNPAAMGTKEPQAAMTYQPWPASGELYPKVI